MIGVLCFLCTEGTPDLPSGACVLWGVYVRVCVCVCVCLKGISHSYLIVLEPKKMYL